MTAILLIGSKGQVGQELHLRLGAVGSVVAVDRTQLDLTNPEAIRQCIRETQPAIIVNAAAYTAVDRAESDPETAYAVNATAPMVMAEEAQLLGTLLIHLSTDYVFSGVNHTPYVESDVPAPTNVYGVSKLAGENAIRQSCPNHAIVRTAWVYGSHGKGNFAKTMLRLGAEREEIRVVADQIGTPTFAGDIADAIVRLIQVIAPGPSLDKTLLGTYHFTNSGMASWYDFAVAIFEEAKRIGFPLRLDRVIPITTAEYPTTASRPAYSVLSCRKINAALGTIPPHWRQSLRTMLLDLYSQTC